MSFIREVVTDAAIGVGVAERLEELSAIRRPGCAAVIWRRSPPPGFRTWIDALAPARLPRARAILRPEAIRDAVDALWSEFATPPGAARDWLAADIDALAGAFAATVAAPYLRLRLDVVNANACRRFHIDRVTARLICTYRGTGTQYGISTDGAEPTRIFTAPTGAPMVLRGTLWPEAPRSGLLHRSPPIEGTGETRLVLVLDPMSEPFEEE